MIYTKMLETGLVLDNEYLKAYCELIETEALDSAITFKTNCHHIIPKCFYPYLQRPVDNSATNLVHLLHKHHLLAHYYLTLCTTGELHWKLIAALTYIVGKYELETNDLEHYQRLQEEGRRQSSIHHTGNKHSDQTKQKMSKTHTGVARTEYERQCISAGWARQTPEEKARIGNMNSVRCKGRIYINNGQIAKMIWPDEFESYRQQGFSRGNLPKNIETRLKACKAAYEKRQKEMPGLKAKEVMQKLNITRPTLCKYVKQGLIKVDACINGQYRYNAESVEALLNNRIK